MPHRDLFAYVGGRCRGRRPTSLLRSAMPIPLMGREELPARRASRARQSRRRGAISPAGTRRAHVARGSGGDGPGSLRYGPLKMFRPFPRPGSLLVMAAMGVTVGAAVACNSQGDVAKPASSAQAAASSTRAPGGKLRIVEAPEGKVEEIVKGALASARAEGRTLVVY